MERNRFAYVLVAVFAVLSAVLGYLLLNEQKVELVSEVKPETSHATVLQEIERLGKLELVRYRLKDILEHKATQKKLFMEFKSKVVLVVSGEAVGCIDLTKMTDSDLRTLGDSLYVRLPEPELCYAKVNHDESKVYNAEMSYFVDVDASEMVDDAYRAAEAQISASALKGGILEEARRNGELLLRPLFEKVSGKTVIFAEMLPDKL